MKFPYGLSDFYQMITEGYYYVDRTDRIRLLEATGKLLLFLRPRRFGKSLLLSMLENYYDINKANEFDRLFGHLAIGRQPTPHHNRYLILRLDFSTVRIAGTVERIEQALHDHINVQIRNCLRTYAHLLQGDVIIERENAVASFESLLGLIKASGQLLYLLIDEYDNFANEVLMAGGNVGQQRYQELIEGEGIFKTFFKAFKAATSGQGLDRIFIVGVSPVVLSDVSSGFNVAGNIYLWPNFNDLCGFTEAEMAEMVRQVSEACHLTAAKVSEALILMRAFYNGYSFSYGLPPTIYNSTMVLYFLHYLQTFCTYPRQLFDSNLAMDRAKLAYIAHLPNGEALLLTALQEQPSLAVPQIEDRFGVMRMLQVEHDMTFMASLLYYFGVLTLSNETTSGGEAILRIPNQVARKLYADQIGELLLPTVGEREEGQRVAQLLYQEGEMQPLCDFIETHYFRVFSNRDYRWANELTIKTAFLVLLFNDTFYLMDSEPAFQRTYGDLWMLIRPEMRKYQLNDVLIEFEYVALSATGLSGEQASRLTVGAAKQLPSVQKKLTEARQQLHRYRGILQAKYGAILRLKSYAVVAVGFDRLVWEEV